ncbi:MAG: class I SAM-dependent methyltransferase [Nanoarchaeota archaeon]
MEKANYNKGYSENLPKSNDLLVNRETLFKKTLAELKLKPSDKILEVGCDKGNFIDFLQGRANKKEQVVGIDLNKEAIKSSNQFNTFIMDATKMTFPDNSFNKVYSFHVIEHIPHLRVFLVSWTEQ